MIGAVEKQVATNTQDIGKNKEDIANPIGYVSCDVYDEKLSNDNFEQKSYRMKTYFYLFFCVKISML